MKDYFSKDESKTGYLYSIRDHHSAITMIAASRLRPRPAAVTCSRMLDPVWEGLAAAVPGVVPVMPWVGFAGAVLAALAADDTEYADIVALLPSRRTCGAFDGSGPNVEVELSDEIATMLDAAAEWVVVDFGVAVLL